MTKKIIIGLSIIGLFAACKNSADPAETAATSGYSGCVLPKNGVENVQLGQPIPKGLGRIKIQSAEGEFTIYQVKRPDGQGVLAKVFPIQQEGDTTDIAHMIEYIGTDCKSDKGVGVGSSLGDVCKAYPGTKVFTSEIEGRTTANTGEWSFLLNAYFPAGEQVGDSVDQKIKVKAIVLMRKPQ
jgi:hypothetical protein